MVRGADIGHVHLRDSGRMLETAEGLCEDAPSGVDVRTPGKIEQLDEHAHGSSAAAAAPPRPLAGRRALRPASIGYSTMGGTRRPSENERGAQQSAWCTTRSAR